MTALQKRLKNIEAKIDRQRRLRDDAVKRRQSRLVRIHERRLAALIAEKRKVEERIEEKNKGVEGGRARPKSMKAQKPPRGKSMKEEKESGPFWKRVSRTKKRAEAPPPEKPKGVADPYAQVKITRANAKKLLDYYMRRVKRPLISKKARNYFAARVNECSRVLRGGGGKKIVQLQSQAAAMRAIAAKARVRRDYAAATRLTERADQLDREARGLEAHEGSNEPNIWTPDAPEGTTAPKAGGGEDTSTETAEEDESSTDISTTSDDTPWYKSPLVWVGIAAVAGIAIFARPKGGMKFSVRGPKSSSPNVTFRPGRPKKSKPAAA